MAKTPIVIFDAEHAQAGVATSDFSKDGGFSPLDKGQNLWIKKGLLYAGPTLISNSGTVNKIVAWAIGYNNTTMIPLAVGVNDNKDGFFYKLLYTTGAGTQELTTTTKDYTPFQTDAIYYKGFFYVSSKIDIGRFTGAFGSASYTWWSALLGASNLNLYTPHHFFIYDGIMYITDDYRIHSWDGTNAVDSAFTVPSTYKITTAVVYKNKAYIFANADYGTGKERFTPTKCFIFDKRVSEDEYIDDFEINDKVYTAKVHDGVLYLWTSKAFGYWTGIKFKKILDLDPNYPVYKQMVTPNSEVLMFSHKKDIITFDGEKISYLFSTENHTALSSYQVDAILCGYSDYIWASINNVMYRLNFADNSGDGKGYHRFNRIDFDQNVHLRDLFIQFGESMESGSDMPVTFFDENGAEQTIGDIKYTNGDRYYKHFTDIDEKCASLQLRIQNKTNAKPIKKITAWIEPAGDDIKP